MNDIVSALGAKLTTHGSVYFGDAKEPAQYPYIVFRIQGEGAEYSSCARSTSAIRTTAVEVHIFSESSRSTGSLLESISADIEDNGLSMDDSYFLAAKTIDKSMAVDPEREQAGERVWQGTAIFELMWTKGE